MGCPPYTPLSKSWLSGLGTGLWILGSDIKKQPLCEKTYTGQLVGHSSTIRQPTLYSYGNERYMVSKGGGGGAARPQEEPSRGRDGGGEHGCKPRCGFTNLNKLMKCAKRTKITKYLTN